MNDKEIYLIEQVGSVAMDLGINLRVTINTPPRDMIVQLVQEAMKLGVNSNGASPKKAKNKKPLAGKDLPNLPSTY